MSVIAAPGESVNIHSPIFGEHASVTSRSRHDIHLFQIKNVTLERNSLPIMGKRRIAIPLGIRWRIGQLVRLHGSEVEQKKRNRLLTSQALGIDDAVSLR